MDLLCRHLDERPGSRKYRVALMPMGVSERGYVPQEPSFATICSRKGVEVAGGGDGRQRALDAGDGVEEVQLALAVCRHNPSIGRADPDTGLDGRGRQGD